MVDEPVCVEYDLVPDRDLNAAGLVYFANYPLILDICERKVLSNAKLKLTPDLIDRRTLVRRRSAYLGNAHRHDTVVVEMQAWVHNPFLADDPSPEKDRRDSWPTRPRHRSASCRSANVLRAA